MCGNLKWILRLWSVSALTHTRHYHSKAMDARMHTSSHPINSRQLFPFCSLSFLFIQFSHFTIRPFPYYHYNSRNGICDVFFLLTRHIQYKIKCVNGEIDSCLYALQKQPK